MNYCCKNYILVIYLRKLLDLIYLKFIDIINMFIE